MKVSNMASQRYFRPSIHVSVLSLYLYLSLPLPPSLCLCLSLLHTPVLPTPPTCVLPFRTLLLVISPATLFSVPIANKRATKSARSNQCAAACAAISLIGQPLFHLRPWRESLTPKGMTVILHLRGYYSTAPLPKCSFYNSQSKIIAAVPS